MRITSRGEYGVRALFDLALHYGQGAVPLKSIAERQDISDHYLEQLMSAMRKGGLVKSVRGALGGYELAHAPQDITIGQIIRTLEGPILALPDDDTPATDELHRLAVEKMWSGLAEKINDALDGKNLADLVEDLEKLRASEGAVMWHI